MKKNLISFSIISVALLLSENVESAQKHNTVDTRWNVNKQPKQKELTQQTKLPRKPSAKKTVKKRESGKHATLTLDMLDETTAPKLLNSPPSAHICVKNFSPNIEQFKFDKFCMSDDECTLVKQNTQETFFDFNLPIICTRSDLNILKTECFIPYGFTLIDQRIMMDNKNLTKVSTTETMKHVGDSAFLNCSSLSHFEIIGTPNITYIGKSSFKNTNLQKAIIPYGVRYIDDNAYADCRSLEEIHIPESVTGIGINIVQRCPNLKDVFLPHTATIKLTKAINSTFYFIEVKFSGITDGFYNQIGSYGYLNIHRKNANNTYTNISIYKDVIVSCTSNLCRNALLEFDSTCKDNICIF